MLVFFTTLEGWSLSNLSLSLWVSGTREFWPKKVVCDTIFGDDTHPELRTDPPHHPSSQNAVHHHLRPRRGANVRISITIRLHAYSHFRR